MSAYMIVIYVLCGVYMILNFKYDIQMFQQNSYRIPRYWKWLRRNITSGWRCVDVACILLLFSILLPYSLAAMAVALVALAKIALIMKKKYKKPLVFTKRVWRLYILCALIAVGGYIAVV